MERIFNALAWISLLIIPALAIYILILATAHEVKNCTLQAEDGSYVPCSYYSNLKEVKP